MLYQDYSVKARDCIGLLWPCVASLWMVSVDNTNVQFTEDCTSVALFIGRYGFVEKVL